MLVTEEFAVDLTMEKDVRFLYVTAVRINLVEVQWWFVRVI